MIGDAAMEGSSVSDESPLLRTKKKQAACQEWLRPVSLKLFIHHTEMRQHLLLQPWCVGAEAIRKSGWALIGERAADREGCYRKVREKRCLPLTSQVCSSISTSSFICLRDYLLCTKSYK